MTTDKRFSRTELLIGENAMERLAAMNVILFGVGGVGGWCAEGLVRSGVGALTLVDPDLVCPTNINRQLAALSSTIGMPKVEVMANRLRDINPDLRIATIQRTYSVDTADDFDLSSYDIIIDAIDSLSDKALLILRATAAGKRLYSSMGAALKMDASKVAVAEFWKVKGCPLAAALRRWFKKHDVYPRRKFKCVYADELIANKRSETVSDDGSMSFGKVSINGTFPTTVAIFGLTLANVALIDAINSAG